ncbi:hypothetical protein, variant 1 [Aphanomyces invadans]|uniref:PAP/OAS1 substrate-binding-related domain-containing protein n=1 Tax=Aphanomyces invadans TaxID=157072 RepID=A0A024TCU9_9STRA|nr:hypothetical protein, variant 1 [Aphanomyces invadans]ETV91839.1 hypothetical protein, variant 1 [Aphanomyces invadans]|eukprot:XP_008879477.1 hypothetical protein, variant 1 [Aphanomyces invadans]
MSTPAAAPPMTALEEQRRRLQLEREKMRSRSRPKPAADAKSVVHQEPTASDATSDRRSSSRESISPPSPLESRSSSSSRHGHGSVVNVPAFPLFRPEASTERKARGSNDKLKVSAWNKVKSIDVKRELAENVVVQVLDDSEASLPQAASAVDTPFRISVQLRDTSWRVTRRISDYILLRPLVPNLPPLDAITADMPYAAVRMSFQVALQSAVRLIDPWTTDAFVEFFDNHFGIFALMLHAKQLTDRLVTVETAHATTKAHLKACQDAVGSQQVLLNTLKQLPAPTTAACPTAPPSFLPLASSFPSALSAPFTASPPSSALWESTWGSASPTLCMLSTPSRHLATQTPMWVPSNDLPTAADLRIVRVVSQLSPTPAAVTHRLRIFHSISSIIKRKLLPVQAQVMLVGGSAAHVFLPDSPLRIGVFIPSNSSTTTPSTSADLHWHMKVNEGLCQASNAVCHAPCTNDDSTSLLLIQHVELSNAVGNDPHVTCNVGQVMVDICANPMHDIRAAYFISSIDSLIGRNHLFKRSVLLVHGWLLYEGNTPSGSASHSSDPRSTFASNGLFNDSATNPSSLSLYAIATLVLYVFNLFHDSIHMPLQAAAHFFGLFAAFPWDGFCVAIEGPRDLRSLTSPPQRPRDGAAPLWLSQQILRMHRSGQLDPPMAPVGPHTAVFCNDEVKDESDADEVARMLQFPIKSINIMDPIDSRVNLGHALSAKQATQFRQALDHGATKLHSVLAAMKKEMTAAVSTSLGSTSSVSLLDGCFRGVSTRFQSGWRPDTAVVVPFDHPDRHALADDLLQSLTLLPQDSSSMPPALCPFSTSLDAPPPEDTLAVCLESLRHDVLVCDFVVTGRVTAPAVYSMAMEVLANRGAMPIGEIGKCLQEMVTSTAAALSVVLKEQFGGLKKFLEQYPAVFIVSSDHPFNPKVYLQRCVCR